MHRTVFFFQIKCLHLSQLDVRVSPSHKVRCVLLNFRHDWRPRQNQVPRLVAVHGAMPQRIGDDAHHSRQLAQSVHDFAAVSMSGAIFQALLVKLYREHLMAKAGSTNEPVQYSH